MIVFLAAGGLALAAIVFLLLSGARRAGPRSARTGRPPTPGDGARAGGPRPGRCTLCGSLLAAGERMKSDILPGKGDRMMRIYGCGHCLGSAAARAPRFCPVCGGELGPGDHAIARFFERPGRAHVHILGCTRCRRPAMATAHGR